MTIEEQLKEVWRGGHEYDRDAVSRELFLHPHDRNIDWRVDNWRLCGQQRAQVDHDVANERVGVLPITARYVQQCKQTRQLIERYLIEALTSELPYVRTFAKLVASERRNE